MEIALIAAVAENNVIGGENKLLWHLPEDLKFFKSQTSGHHIIMGRKTFESIGGGRPLPNRTSIIITRQANYKAEGCIVVNSVEEALKAVKEDDKIFFIGGGEIYKLAVHKVDTMYLTHVKAEIVGETIFPEINWDAWEKTESEYHLVDEKHKYEFEIARYKRR